jgi:hypothetical protein
MRTPRWLRDFFGWRWAPCLALTAGALLFVLLALLLIPERRAETPRIANAQSVFERARALPERAPPTPSVELASTRAPAPAPAPAHSEPPAVAAVPPNFAANIADRGDRPQRSLEAPP